MAYKIGLVGLTNTGKSFSRRTIKKGEEVFILSPSHKALHIRDSKGEPLKPLNISTEQSKDIASICQAAGIHRNALASVLLKRTAPFSITGNWYVMKDIRYLEDWIKLISLKRPDIKVLILPDFTHYISEVIANKEFIQRKSGGEAFQRLTFSN
jgi:hypothetical protein